LNRCLVLSVDEAREQTRAIHRLQRERRTLDGLVARTGRDAVVALHRNAQRLLRPLAVVNPYAPELTFSDAQIRTRRDHEKYLTLIDTIALLHQHQREVKRAAVAGREIEYIEVTLADIATANRLAHEVLGRSLDELPAQTRVLLGKLDRQVSAACGRLEMERGHFRFSRREVRETTGWGDTQLRLHLARLVELEYLLVHQGGRGQSYVYELLLAPGDDGQRPLLPGLIDVERLESGGTTETTRGKPATSRGKRGENAPPSRPQNGGVAGGARGGVSVGKERASLANGVKPGKNAHLADQQTARSYREERRSGALIQEAS